MCTPHIQIGTHLVSQRSGYTHHGIYVGDNKVIHYSGFSKGMSTGPVEETSLEVFCAGKGYHIRHHKNRKYPRIASVKRAYSRIGEDAYSLFGNNCEHLVNWCINGDHASQQLDKAVVITPTIGLVAGFATRAGLQSSGVFANFASSGVGKGLAMVGGGTVAGVSVMSGTVGLTVSSILNHTVFRDNTKLGSAERYARSVARKTSIAGAVVGTLVSIGIIGRLHNSVEYNVNIAILVLAPVISSAMIGYAVYRCVLWHKTKQEQAQTQDLGVNKLTDTEKQALFTLLTAIARADGKVTDEEIAFIQAYAKECCINYQAQNHTDIRQACAHIQSHTSKVVAIQELIKLALHDGQYEKVERTGVLSIAHMLSLPLKEFIQIENRVMGLQN